MLHCIQRWYLAKHGKNLLSETDLLQLYNSQIVSLFLVEKISISDVYEACWYLAECDLLEIVSKGGQAKSKRMSAMAPDLARKKGNSLKQFNVELKIDLDELREALELADKFEEEQN